MGIDQEELRKAVVANLEMGKEVTEEQLWRVIHQTIREQARGQYIRMKSCRTIARNIFHSIGGMDILQDLLEDEEVTEIMVNGSKQVFVEKNGQLSSSGREFSSHEKLEDIAQQIASKGNRIVNESSPILDVRLKDGSRVNIVLPPIAMEGPVITIRKFPKEAMTMERLLAMGAITKEADHLLQVLVKAKYNVFISGGTGAGKTTFLNILSNYIPSHERVVTIEDSAELQIQNIHNIVRLEARNANVEGKNEVTIRELIKCALRMRPDRVIVGEIRDATAIDMLAAFNTGHDGSLSTGHVALVVLIF